MKPRKTIPLFEPGGPQPNPIRCTACGRTFRAWRGTSSHGLAHVRRGEAWVMTDPNCPSTSGHRYLFFRT